MAKRKQRDCLHCKIIDMVMKYGRKHGAVNDGDIVRACVCVIAEVMGQHDLKTQADIRKFVDDCIAQEIASAEHEPSALLH